MQSNGPFDILESAYQQVIEDLNISYIENQEIAQKIKFICESPIGAGVRVLFSGALAKVHRPDIDIRKPYTEIGGDDSYSGRTYDESYIGPFTIKYDLPCNRTTGFLTPAFRTKNQTLSRDYRLVGRSPELYNKLIDIINDVYEEIIAAEDLLKEIICCLVNYKIERNARLENLLKELRNSEETIPLSSEDIVYLIEQHLKCKNASRLPVLIVAAVYNAATEYLQERVLPLEAHNAADIQTGALGDVQITLKDDDKVVTVYEVKFKAVNKEDIDIARQKIAEAQVSIDNYLFVTTDLIKEEVANYARGLYTETNGIEFAILDCIGFLRHFLHLFHRLRMNYINMYQEYLLKEPESAVSQNLKEIFIHMRMETEKSYTTNQEK